MSTKDDQAAYVSEVQIEYPALRGMNAENGIPIAISIDSITSIRKQESNGAAIAVLLVVVLGGLLARWFTSGLEGFGY